MEIKVQINEKQSQVEAKANNETVGLINYSLQGETLFITHTEVPSRYEGQGIAGKMTKDLLDYAKSKEFKVKPLCSYARVYISRHPEYSDLLDK